MSRYPFSAYALESEVDLNRVAAALRLDKKLRQEEPLVLDPGTLASPTPGGPPGSSG